MRKIRLLIHLEPTDAGLVWWTESPDVPGFSGTGQHLDDARIRAELAIRQILADQGVEEVSFTYQLVASGELSEGSEVKQVGGIGRTADGPSGRTIAVVSAA